MKLWRILGMAVGITLLAAPAWAQASVTASDLDRLEATSGEIERNLTSLEKTDATLAATVRESLTRLREDIVYLKVKLRREGLVTRAEYGDVRDKLETLRVRSLGDAGGARVTAQPVLGDPRTYSVPVGTQLDVRLQTSLNSGTAKVEQRFEATTVVDYRVDGVSVIPAGSVVRGFVSSVQPAGRIERRGSLTLSFDEIRIAGRAQRFRATVDRALDGSLTQDSARIGAGAVLGGIIGGLLGGGKGALVGVLVGGGGTIASTEGADVDLPAGTVLRVHLDQPLDVLVGGGSDRP